MNKKLKKKLEQCNAKIQKLQQQLSGARKQADEPGEVARLERELAAAKEELEKLKNE